MISSREFNLSLENGENFVALLDKYWYRKPQPYHKEIWINWSEFHPKHKFLPNRINFFCKYKVMVFRSWDYVEVVLFSRNTKILDLLSRGTWKKISFEDLFSELDSKSKKPFVFFLDIFRR